ncbi:hypothetical protein FisN_9Hh309 [Fistulifera solaris]|jgi:hypothetical protein|uniref:Uncharacterized protein n=1 Tax=Fistulifera solaris TaxID=1519565 RepID=A0A1Z5JBD9_FISSO|nr:hypothetical protein FisN_9Hh309 [Fistulifera solaris]|eukprot:GAX11212.1 hypothetical protein FisN_9Hh309 [Fistulifera solaris]
MSAPEDPNSQRREEARMVKSQKEKLRQEGLIVESVLSSLQRKLDNIRMTRGASSVKLEAAEKEILLKLNNSGLLPGAAAGILSFVLLRRVRRIVLQRRFQASLKPPSNNIPGANGNSHVQNSPFQAPSSSFPPPISNGPPPLQEPLVLKVLGLILDGTVSFAVAVMASVQFTDMKMILQEFSRIPLLQGHSVVAEEFCPVVLEELQRLDRDMKSSDWKKDVQSLYLKAIVDFGKHCEQRRVYENRLQQEQGLDPEKPFHMSIPAPGVPQDDWEDNNSTLTDSNSEWMNEDTSWADDLTRDQGDDK